MDMIKCNIFVIIMMLSSCQYGIDTVEVTPMLEMFDAMQMMWTGEEFDRIFYEELIDCMNYIDPAIKTAQDGAWQGIIDYWNTNGASNDIWGLEESSYVELNITVTELNGMTIYEPCGYSSNVAYYYPVIEICLQLTQGSQFSMPVNSVKTIGKGFAQLAMGSAFWHGTHTILGNQQDNELLSVMAYQFYQASIESLERSPILHDLDHNYRESTASEMIDKLDYMYTNLDVTEWLAYTDNLPIPDYKLIYSGTVISTITLIFPPFIVNVIVDILSNMLGVPEDTLKFVKEFYIPEIRSATSNVKVSIFQKIKLGLNALGAGVKILYAFLWQETIITTSAIIFNPQVNYLGTLLLPLVNKITSVFMSFKYFKKQFQNGKNIYPGDSRCNAIYPHSKWHLQSAIGLLDFVFVSDEIHKILS